MYHILICDDEQDIVNALKIYLMNPDFKLFEANTGRSEEHTSELQSQ